MASGVPVQASGDVRERPAVCRLPGVKGGQAVDACLATGSVVPFGGAAAAEDEGRHSPAVTFHGMFKDGTQVGRGVLAPEGRTGNLAQFVVGVVTHTKGAQVAHPPMRRVQIQETNDLGVGNGANDIVKLPVEGLEVVDSIPLPDRRIFRVREPE